MTPTEMMLFKKFGAPVVPLSEICEPYFDWGLPYAKAQAALNALPCPAWRMTDSQKSPLMVHLSDLAAHIDAKAERARKNWKASQLD